MVIHSATPRDLQELPLHAIDADWFGDSLQPPPSFGFAIDHHAFHFLAEHQRPAHIHPQARHGIFQPELWKYDVAEFFLTDPVRGHYLEFNLAPNGGWWSCEFTAPLVRRFDTDLPLPDVHINAASDSAGWRASASLPLAWLKENMHFGPDARLNATFILESPNQRFLTAHQLGAENPNFHQPDAFPVVRLPPNF